MSESNQPFTDMATRKQHASDAARIAWIVAGIAFVLMAVFLLLWTASREKLRHMDTLRASLEETTNKLASVQTESQQRQDQIAALQSRMAELQKEKDQVGQMAKGLESEMRADLESKDVTISKLQGKLTVNILDRVMFDSGEAVLKPEGQGVMKKIADFLAKHPELKIHVVGHTDNVPIRAGARGRFASNWELSAARALAAVHFLTEQGGLDPRRVGSVAYGEFRPIADNATADGRAKNRRIAITILPDELAGADTLPPATATTGTNSPPASAQVVPIPAQ